MEITKLYSEGSKRTYLVGLKSKISKEAMTEYARKEFRVRADQVVLSSAVREKSDIFSVELADGNYWCATRASK